MGILGVEQEFIPTLVPVMSVIITSLTISISHDANAITFVGIFCTLGAFAVIFHRLWKTLNDTWLGVLLGHNVNLREMGKWAVVTGGELTLSFIVLPNSTVEFIFNYISATDGIGLAFARQLAERGLNIVLMSRSIDRLEKCANEIELRYGVETKIIQVDFSQDIFEYDANVDKKLEGLEIGTLINNVGMFYETPDRFDRVSQSVDFIKNMINVNVVAVTMMTRAVLPGMLNRGKGVVVNIGSFASLEGGFPFVTLYSAVKSYMETLTLNLAKEYKEQGIYFQYQCPGYVTTKLSKIRNSHFFIPTPDQYVKNALKSIGLQQCTPSWPPQRIMLPIIKIGRFLLPGPYDTISTQVSRTFWLFAKKRQMQKDMEYIRKAQELTKANKFGSVSEK